ncbi:helix-turn-helix domain-containing protein [Arthrobacter sp. zg-Y1219]|uniref:PucR family transcriptional regulator n=1 Tax=Arthrobacter sp. zg-Y1219 TaxID=3049067 RepID=UPI0024C26C3D|nr:helix-turn-helix domain-containing protein [Arthrobacter sp. zg-Y1219]
MYLESIVKDLFNQLHAPLLVLDTSMELVAHSIHEDAEHDATQVAMIVSRRGTAGAVESFKRYRVKYSTEPVRIPGRAGGRGHIVVTVRSAGQPTGYLTFPDLYGEDIPEAHLAAIEAASSEIGEALRDRMLDRRRGREHVKQLLAGLLGTDRLQHNYAVQEILAGRLLTPAAQYCVVVLEAGRRENDQASARRHLENAVEQITAAGAPRCMGAVIHGEGIVIVPECLDSDTLSGLLAEHGLDSVCAGSGGRADTLEETAQSYQQARTALQAVRRDRSRYGRSAAWNDLGADRILLQLPLETMSGFDLSPGIQRLFAAKNAEMLVESVRAYLDAGGNAVEASRVLHVHRSTLYYRLDRAAEVSGLDFADGKLQRELHLELRVADLIGLQPRSC